MVPTPRILFALILFLSSAEHTRAQRDRNRATSIRARDGGRRGVVHWPGTAGSGVHKQAMFLHKSGHQKRTPVVRGDMEPDMDESDVHPLSQAAYWYRHPGSVHGGSNKLYHDWIDARYFNMAWEWSNMMENAQDQRNSLVPSKCCSGL